MAEPWDDSALINAFNSAIVKYKTMHGVPVTGKGLHKDDSQTIVNLVSDKQPVELSNEHELGQTELSEKKENAVESPHHDGKDSTHGHDHTENNNVKEPHSGYNGCAAPHYDTQHHGHSTSAENCYLCQWNAYYYQAGARASPAASFPNGLQCQFCGHVNHLDEVGKYHYQNQAPQSYQSQQDASAFPDIVKAAVAEALKTAGGQNSTSIGLESSQASSNFSDVAVAWFLAGFHTSRYLSRSGKAE